jgi:hypothetical protein
MNLDIFGKPIAKDQVLRYAYYDREDHTYHLTQRQMEILSLDPGNYMSYQAQQYDRYWIVPVNDAELAQRA